MHGSDPVVLRVLRDRASMNMSNGASLVELAVSPSVPKTDKSRENGTFYISS
jgi:hypothetical protein